MARQAVAIHSPDALLEGFARQSPDQLADKTNLSLYLRADILHDTLRGHDSSRVRGNQAAGSTAHLQ